MGRAFEYRRSAKEKRWDKMSKIFPKLAKAIQMAASEGGSDPETNSKLRAAIQNAKAENMPKDNIENAINRAVGKDAEALNEVTFEEKVHMVFWYLSSVLPTIIETVANIKSYLARQEVLLLPRVRWNLCLRAKQSLSLKKLKNAI